MKKICLLVTLIIVLGIPAASMAGEQNTPVTRGQFVKGVLIQAETDIGEVTESSFTDVTDPEFIPYVETAYKNGMVSGYGDYFGPDQSITKEEAVIIIVRTFGEMEGLNKIAPEDVDQALTFSDSETISSWARPYAAYALITGLVTEEGDTFSPQVAVSAEQADDMIASADEVYTQLFTRDGLSASDMLVLINEKTAEVDTYKQKGTLFTDMELILEGTTQEQIEENEELEAFLDGGMDISMQMDMEVSVQTPDKIYITQSVVSEAETEEMTQYAESFIDGSVMYTRMSGTDKWVMQDMGPVMEQIQAISDREPYQMTQLSEDELKIFKEFARYENDVELDGKEYYVIGLDIDKDTYKEYYIEIIEKVMDSVVTLQIEDPRLQEDPAFDPEQYKQMMKALVADMEVELCYKYYVNKETKMFDKMWLSQEMIMPMEQFMTEIVEILGEEAPPFSVKVLSRSEGEFELYDFGVEVEFPVITEDDILDPAEPMPQPVPQETETPAEE